MSLIPLLPIYHRFNREHFDGLLVQDSEPLVSVKWSDGRLRSTAGFYRRISKGWNHNASEIVLSTPVLGNLPKSAIESTLCHEMIHAWVDLILGVEESHGPNFLARMAQINQSQTAFQVSLRHKFPLSPNLPKWWGICTSCGLRSPYKRIVKNAACRHCCNTLYGGRWNASCLLTYEPVNQEY